MLNFAEHDLAGARPQRQRAQVIAVEAAHPRAEGLVAERHRRLRDRGRKYDVEADDRGAALDDRAQHLPDLARPGDGRRAVEGWRAKGLLAERDDDRRGVFRERQRSAVRKSMDKPRSGSSAGEAATRLTARAITRAAKAARSRGPSMSVPRSLSRAGSAAAG